MDPMPTLLTALSLLACVATAPRTPPEASAASAGDSTEEAVVNELSPLTSEEMAKAMDFRDVPASAQRYQDMLPRAEATSVDIILELGTRYARTQGLLGDFEAGHTVLDRAASRLDQASPSASAHVRVPLERGRLHNSAGDKAAAQPLFAEARAQAERVGHDPLWLDAVHMQAIAAGPEAALAFNREAIAFAEASEDPKARGWLGALYNNTGWAHMERGEHAEALELFEKGVVFREEAGKPVPLRIARYTVGAALRKLDRCEEALPIQQTIAAEWAAEDAVDGYVEEELGECLLALGRADEARAHLAIAHTELSKDAWLVEHEPERLRRLGELAADQADAPSPSGKTQ